MDKYCRACARSSELPSFNLTTESQITKVRIDDMLVFCTQQEISTDDSLPQQICPECFTALNSAFLFRQLTYQSAASFQEITNNVFTVSVLESSVDREVALPSTPEVATKKEPMGATEKLFETADIDPGTILSTSEMAIKEEQMDAEEELFETSSNDPEDTTESCDNEASTLIEIGKRQKGTRMVSKDPLQMAESDDEGIPTDVKKRIQEEIIEKSSKTRVRLSYVCKECYYNSHNWNNFKRHQNNAKHSSFTRIRPSAFIMPTNLLPASSALSMRCERRKTKKTLYICEDCNFRTFRKFTFIRHQSAKKHDGELKFSEPFPEAELARLHNCPACGDVFSSYHHLASHKKKSAYNYRVSLDAKAKQRTKQI